MFQRQTKQAFPLRNILLVAAATVAALYFLLKKNAASEAAEPAEEAAEEKARDGGYGPQEWYFALHEYPDFVPDVRAYEAALRSAAEAVSQRGAYKGFSVPWTVQGPANIGARINCIAVHPTNSNIIYIGYSQGGAWKTTDGGLSWNAIFDAQPYQSVGEITLDPQNPNIIFLGTGDPNISILPMIGDGIWKSTDGGQTWQNLGLAAQRIIPKIILHPTNSNHIHVASMGLPFERNTDRGYYKSTNGGSTWAGKLQISDDTGIIDLVMSPSNPDLLYASSWARIRNNKESLILGPTCTIWKSTDGGNNWLPIPNGFPQDTAGRIGLAIDPANDQHVWATYCNKELRFGGLYETFDGGATWQQNPCTGLDLTFQSNFAWYFQKLYVNPLNNQDIWLLGVETWRSQNAGQTWEKAVGIQEHDVHADHHAMAFVDANTMLIGTDGGLYKTIDNASTWTKIENIPTTQFYRVAWNVHEPEYYYGGAQDNGTSVGNATAQADWIRVFGGDGFQPVFHPTDPNIRYYETQNGGLWGMTDGGFFEQATDGIDQDDRRAWDMPFAISKNDETRMFCGTYRIYQSYGHSPIWYPSSPDLTDGVIFGPRFHTISCIDDSPLDPELLFAGTSDGNVWVGYPNSESWTNVTAGLPDRYVSSIKASPTYPNRVFVTHTGYKDNDFTSHIHCSNDLGATWIPIAGDLPNLAVYDVLVLPEHQDSVLFVATDLGVYGTLDAGVHWERLGTGMPNVPVFDLEVNPAARTLIAGTHARSIMTFPLDSIQYMDNSSTNNPANVGKTAQLQLSPNPASGEVQLQVEHLQPKQIAVVKVTDLRGRILWEGRFAGLGQSSKRIDLSHFPAGIYVAFAETNGKVWGQKKFVVGTQ